MEKKRLVLILAILALILLIASSLSGILLDDGGSPYKFSSLRGEEVEIYGGNGLYQFDSVFKAVLFRGFDWGNIIVGLLFFVWGIYLYNLGQLKGKLLLGAFFSYLAYNYIIGVMGNAFNILFLVWTAIFSLGLFGLAAVLMEIDISSFKTNIKQNFPRRSLSIYMILLGLFLLIQYMTEILTVFGSDNAPPSLGIYTTLELAALELGLMIPLHFLGGIRLWKQKVSGYLMAIILLFTALMTFISLSVSSFIFFIQYDRGDLFDVLIPIILVLVASGFSIVVFKSIRVDNGTIKKGE